MLRHIRYMFDSRYWGHISVCLGHTVSYSLALSNSICFCILDFLASTSLGVDGLVSPLQSLTTGSEVFTSSSISPGRCSHMHGGVACTLSIPFPFPSLYPCTRRLPLPFFFTLHRVLFPGFLDFFPPSLSILLTLASRKLLRRSVSPYLLFDFSLSAWLTWQFDSFLFTFLFL